MIIHIIHSKNSYCVDVEKGITAEKLYLSLNEKNTNWRNALVTPPKKE